MFEQFDPEVRRIAEQLYSEDPVSRHVLADELNTYAMSLREKRDAEFFDMDTAKDVVLLCRRMLAALPDDATEEQHRLTQLAISYLVLEEDIEDDNESMIGFDDDMQVAVAVAERLGLQELIPESARAD